MEKISYSHMIKSEILEKEINNQNEHLWEINMILKGKSAILDNKILLKLENISLAKRVYKYLREICNLKISIKYLISKRFGEHKVYVIEVPNQKGFKDLINRLSQLDNVEIDKLKPVEIQGIIRGIFLATGYIKEPKREYALDFFIDNKTIADKVYNLLRYQDKRAFITDKRNKKLVYLRNSEDIMDILVLIGAVQAFFKYEEVTMVKDLKNKTIREINWEVANETKTLNTAQKQLKMIKYIDENLGISELSVVLQEMCFVRLDNPEGSLIELAEILELSKSGVRNRFRRLEQIYNELREENGDDV